MIYQNEFPVSIAWQSDMDRMLEQSLQRMVDKQIIAKRLEHHEDYENLLLPAIHSIFVELGLQSLVWPEELGGTGLGDTSLANTFAMIIEQVARADVGIAHLLANNFAIQAGIGIEPFVESNLLKSLKGIFTSGQPTITTLVLSNFSKEDSVSNDFFTGLACQVSGTKEKGGWILTGENIRCQCAGSNAGLFGVFFTEKDGKTGFAFLNGDQKGIKHEDTYLKTGLAASLNANIHFDSVQVPKDRIIFNKEDHFYRILSWYHLCCAAIYCGAGLATYEIIKDWGDNRVIKGKGQIFKNNPLCASLMGSIGQRISFARSTLYQTASVLSENDISSKSAYALSQGVSSNLGEMTIELINNAMELMASAGYATEWNLERYWRDVQTCRSYLGPVTTSKIETARHLYESKAL